MCYYEHGGLEHERQTSDILLVIRYVNLALRCRNSDRTRQDILDGYNSPPHRQSKNTIL